MICMVAISRREMSLLAKEEDRIRFVLNLYPEVSEHKKIYDILQKQSNKNAFIRDAILYYNQGIQRDLTTKAELQQMIRETMKELLEPMQEILQEKKDKPIDVDGYKNVF
jgi:hypothetical protein